MLTRDPSIAHPCRRPGRRSSRAARSGTRCSFEGRRLWRRSLTCLLAPLPVAFGPGRREAPFGGGRPAKQSEPARAPPISQTRRIVRGAQLPPTCLPAYLLPSPSARGRLRAGVACCTKSCCDCHVSLLLLLHRAPSRGLPVGRELRGPAAVSQDKAGRAARAPAACCLPEASKASLPPTASLSPLSRVFALA
jgi:hypothetical protein